VNGRGDEIELIVLAATIVMALVGLALAMYIIINSRKDRVAAKTAILNYLSENRLGVLTFEDIRGSIDSAYSDEFLHSLSKSFPASLRFDYDFDERTGKKVKSALWLVSQSAVAQSAPVYGSSAN
jgi:hypothetical protein